MSSNVEKVHPEFENSEYQWRQMRDTVGGPTLIKRSNELYLPMPAPMAVADSKKKLSYNPNQGSDNLNKKELTTQVPWAHYNKYYSEYLHRARFPDITNLTKKTLTGIATKKEPVIELPAKLEYMHKRATNTGIGLKQLFYLAIAELLTTGRYGILVEVQANGEVLFVPYVAEYIRNWKSIMVDSKELLSLLVLKQDVDSDDEFEHDCDDSEFIVLRLISEGERTICVSQKYQSGEPCEIVTPELFGKKFNEIPFTVANSGEMGMSIAPPPLIGVSDISIAIYQKDADMSQTEHLTCNPWLFFTGVDPENGPNTIGSHLAFFAETPDATANYIEPAGTSLKHMSSRITDLKEEASRYGAALLGPGNAQESAETVRMKQSAQGASLKTIVENAQNLIRRSIEIAIDMMQINQEYRFEANLDFSQHMLTFNEIKVLLDALSENAISYETFFENLQKGGVVSKDMTTEKEIDRITNSAPRL